MTKHLTTDVLICGGGPCGLMLANELGQRGIRCLLVDAKPGTAFNPQANATQARTMEHFRRLGFAHEIRAQGLPADHPTDIAYVTRYTGFELARLKLPTAAQAVENIKALRGSWSAAELPHRVSQKFVEATLRRHAQSFPTVDIRYGSALQDFVDKGSTVEATVKPNAMPETEPTEPISVKARFLVGADGPRSMVRRFLGIEWGGETGTQRDFMGGKMFAVYLRAPTLQAVIPHPKAWMWVTVNSQRRAFMAAVDGVSEYAFHAAIHPGEEADGWTAQDAQRIFNEAAGCHVPIEVLSVGTWLAGHALIAQRFQRGRVFIAGDAAHLFTPTGGLGYNTAVEDAVNLGWKLSAVLKNQAPESLLDSYETERKPLAERNTAYAKQFADSVGLFVTKPDLEDDSPQGIAERDHAAQYLDAHARLEFNIPGVTFGGRYDASSIIVKDGTLPPPDSANSYTPTASPGGRAPHAWLEDGSSLYDRFNFEWTLLVLGTDPPDGSNFLRRAEQLGIHLTQVKLPEARLLSLYEAPLALIRPDQIVAWRGHDARHAAEILNQVLGTSTSVDRG